MTLVVDASLVVAALIDDGPVGRWAEQVLVDESLAAPHHMPVEAASSLRRLVISGAISSDLAGIAQAELSSLSVDHFPFAPMAERVWALRDTVTAYDAWYVALAEVLQSPLATLDKRLTRAPGPRCDFRTPPG